MFSFTETKYGRIPGWLKYEKKTPWSKSASELYRPSDSRLSAKWLPTFADRGCNVVSVTDPYGRILGFLGRSCYLFFHVAPQLYSRGWVDPVPDPLLFFVVRGNRTRDPWICSQELWPLDHRGGRLKYDKLGKHFKVSGNGLIEVMFKQI
jgi:hypothetical protein